MNGCDDRAVERALVVEPLFTFVTLCRRKNLIALAGVVLASRSQRDS